MLSDNARSIPIFWGHGSADPLIKLEFCEKSISFLKNECSIKVLLEGDNEVIGIRHKVYRGMEHSSCQEELVDLRTWLKSVIPKDSGKL